MLFWNAECKKDEGLLEMFEFLLLHEKYVTWTSVFVFLLEWKVSKTGCESLIYIYARAHTIVMCMFSMYITYTLYIPVYDIYD